MIKPTDMHWYAVYTHSRAEKKVARELTKQRIEHYLPLIKTLKQWTDRKKKVEEPLIRSYIFVRIPENDYLDVLHTPGVMTLIRFSGKLVAIPDWQIDNLRILLGTSLPITVENRELITGEEVRITRGTLEGLRGIIQKIKGEHKLVISIHALHYHLTVDIDPGFVEIVTSDE
jgi:transcription antitermination factor NusG